MNAIKKLKERFLQYANEVKEISNFKLFLLYIVSYLRYDCTIKDFFTFKLYLLNSRGKKLFVTNGYLMKMYKRINKPELAHLLKSKEETFIKYGKWMNRMWCGVKYNNSLENYDEFIKNNSKCIVKPLELCAGHGIRIIELKDYTAEKLQQECLKNNELIEELIVQHDKMKSLHPDSVNTIRITTEDKKIIGVMMRIGAGGSAVDNACSGGMFAQVDVDNGIVVTNAFNYNGEVFFKHPDTNVTFLGFEIPMWTECIKLIEEAAEILPEIPIIGFDIAITDNGPVIVEVNECPDLALLQQPLTIQLEKRLLVNH